MLALYFLRKKFFLSLKIASWVLACNSMDTTRDGKRPGRFGRGGVDLKEFSNSVANYLSHTLLSKFILIHLHLVPRCVRTMKCCSCCCCEGDSWSAAEPCSLEQWLYSSICLKSILHVECLLLWKAREREQKGKKHRSIDFEDFCSDRKNESIKEILLGNCEASPSVLSF